MRFKQGVNKQVKPETAYWMGRIEGEWEKWFDSPFTITSAFRPGDSGAHGHKKAFDVRRPKRPKLKDMPWSIKDERWHLHAIEGFCKHIQQRWGRYIGVQLEPEWGKGKKYTGPHIHFQLKRRALWPE